MPSIGEGDQWLEIDLDLVTLDRVVQGGVEVQPADGAPAHAVDVEQGHLATPPRVLGAVHRDVGIMEEVVARHALVAQRHADAHRGDHFVTATEDDGLTQHLENALGDLSGVIGRVHALQDRNELVAAEARQRVPGPTARRRRSATTPQQLVADLMPRLSLTTLKRSTSPKSTATLVPVRSAWSKAWSRWSSRQSAVGEAGEGSWNA